jgi:cytochrome d ubiquinol oxidase subunit I
MRTKDAVTPMPGLVVPFVGFTVLYFLLAVVVVVALVRQMGHSPFIPAAGPGGTGSDDAA